MKKELKADFLDLFPLVKPEPPFISFDLGL